MQIRVKRNLINPDHDNYLGDEGEVRGTIGINGEIIYLVRFPGAIKSRLFWEDEIEELW